MIVNKRKRWLVRARSMLRSHAPRGVRGTWNFIKEPLLTILLVLVATTAVARPYYVPTGSMEPTIQIGDELLTSKFAYGYSRYSMPFDIGPSSSTRFLQRMPTRGDIIVFHLPRDGSSRSTSSG